METYHGSRRNPIAPLWSIQIPSHNGHRLLTHLRPLPERLTICRAQYGIYTLGTLQVAIHDALAHGWDDRYYGRQYCVAEYSVRPDGTTRLALRCATRMAAYTALLTAEHMFNQTMQLKVTDFSGKALYAPIVTGYRLPTLHRLFRTISSEYYPFLELNDRMIRDILAQDSSVQCLHTMTSVTEQTKIIFDLLDRMCTRNNLASVAHTIETGSGVYSYLEWSPQPETIATECVA